MHHPPSMMVWQDLSYRGTTQIHFCEHGVKTDWKVYQRMEEEIVELLQDTITDAKSLHSVVQVLYLTRESSIFIICRKMNKTEKAVQMLKKCLHLNPNYIGAYLLLAKVYDGPMAGRLLKHVTKLQSTNANYFAYYAQWLHKKREYKHCKMFYSNLSHIEYFLWVIIIENPAFVEVKPAWENKSNRWS